MIKAVFFDMNETLLNLRLLQEQFDKHFEDKYVLKYWFTSLLHSSTVMGVMNEYENFGVLAGAALERLFFENDKPLSEALKTEILSEFKKLPAYNDVVPALKKLQEKNIRIIAISNSSLEMIKEQLTNAQIISYFDAYYSVDMVNKYKPFDNVYNAVAKKEALKVNEVAMVATHDWDLFGAKKVGLTTAYIERKKTIYNPFYFQPDVKATSLTQLVDQLV